MEEKILAIKALGFEVKEDVSTVSYVLSKETKSIPISKETFEDEPIDSLIKLITQKYEND